VPRGVLGAHASPGARPGADTRVWVTYARVEDVGFDADSGFFADVVTIPDGIRECVLIGTPDADADGGLYCPVRPGDVVLIGIPNGEYDMGACLLARVWGKGRKPPTEAGSGDTPTNDVVWKVRGDRSMKFIVDGSEFRVTGKGGGRVMIETTGSGGVTVQSEESIIVNAPEVLLGAAPAAEVATVGSTCIGSLDVAVLAAAILSPPPSGQIPITCQIVGAAASGVKA
jgi:hypothetical protein